MALSRLSGVVRVVVLFGFLSFKSSYFLLNAEPRVDLFVVRLLADPGDRIDEPRAMSTT